MNNYLLFEPFEKEGLKLKNRVVMTAMTRNFADKDHCPTQLMGDYYERRAANGIGLILTEGTIVHPTGDGYPDVPYIYTKKQREKWAEIVKRVQNHGTKFFMQLWHCGRISHSEYLNGGIPVSSSAIAAEGLHSRNRKPFPVPRALEKSEIPEIIEMFVHSARLALEAGFDGIEIHGGHGYLIDNFFDSRVNHRTDEFGSSIENRCRFALELTKKVLAVAGPSRTSLRISPSREMNGLYEWPNMEEMLAYFIPELDKMGLKILDISCAQSDYYKTSGKVVRFVRALWPHIIIAGASLSPEKADEEIKNGFIDLVTYGRFILANPDFVSKIKNGQELTPYHPDMRKILY